MDGIIEAPQIQVILLNELSPQNDNQTKQVNALLEKYLRHTMSSNH